MEIVNKMYGRLIDLMYFIKSEDRTKRLFLYFKYKSNDVFLRDEYRTINKYEFIIDVGAYNGDSVAYFYHFHKNAYILAFEPTNKYLQIKESPRIEIINSPVLDGTMVDIKEEKASSYLIKGNKMKSVILSNYVNKDCFLKMDCEGSEYIIFKDLIKNDKLKFIKEFVCEFHVEDVDNKFGKVISILEDKYKLHYRTTTCPLARTKLRQDILVHGILK